MKAILISIKPKYVAKILNGEKTIEVRKSMPKCDLPIYVYIYYTKDKPYLANATELFTGKYACISNDEVSYKEHNLNGKVVAKFTLNKVEEIHQNYQIELGSWRYYENEETIEELACLDNGDLQDYLDMKTGYAWHISNLEIFDKPKELSEFRHYNKPSCDSCQFQHSTCCDYHREVECDDIPLTKAPQSWQFIESEK